MWKNAWCLLRAVVDGRLSPEVWLLATGLDERRLERMRSALEERILRRQALLSAEGTDWGSDAKLEELEVALELVERKQAVAV